MSIIYFVRDNNRNRGGRPSWRNSNQRDFNDRGDRGGRGGFGGGRRERPMMHKAVCDTCGNECEVPFQPTSGKPIYCDNCFTKKSGGGQQRRPSGNGQMETVIAKLDKILALLQPTQPVEAKTLSEVEAKVVEEKPEVTEAKEVEIKKAPEKKVVKVKKPTEEASE
ncbi:hypothetical protein IPM62_00755 [Candidatus Woesebacteria bacterium]|nr:MAG: hypothetical protein IPM62_00755 [Candidatus Woesebacteria bacterium]